MRVHPKMKTREKCTCLQAIQDVDEFVSSSEQIGWNLALHHLFTNEWILCSEWVPSDWESKQLIKTSQ